MGFFSNLISSLVESIVPNESWENIKQSFADPEGDMTANRLLNEEYEREHPEAGEDNNQPPQSG